MRNYCFYWDFTTRHRILASQENHRMTISVLLNILYLKNLHFTVIRHDKDIVVHSLLQDFEIWGFSSHFDGDSSLLGYDNCVDRLDSYVPEELAFTIFRVWQYLTLHTWRHITGDFWILTVVLIEKSIFKLVSYLQKKPP